MKKPLKITLIVLGILFGAYTVLGQTNMLKMYIVPTTSNEPGINLNSKIFVSNLVDYNNGDFICYKYENEMLGEHIRVHRLLGKSGDIVEIKNGILYLNDKNVDVNLELKHSYVLNSKEVQILVDKKLVSNQDVIYFTNDMAFVFLIDNVAELNGLSSNIKIEPQSQVDKSIQSIYNENWNRDNFGPLKIPQDKCFVIGDNRHNSEDSRYIGLINESDIVGTVVQK